MPKINSTFGTGYYIPDDFDYRQIARPVRPKRGRDATHAGPALTGPDDDGISDGPSLRQTWMLEFSVVCDGCGGTNPRARKVYANVRRLREKYLKTVAIYQLTTRCMRCAAQIVWRTDPATASYVVVSGARRAGADAGEAEAEAAGGSAAGGGGAQADGEAAPVSAEQAHLDQMQRDQEALREGERVQAGVDEQAARLFFPADDIRAAIDREAAAARRAALGGAESTPEGTDALPEGMDGVDIDPGEADAIRDRFAKLAAAAAASEEQAVADADMPPGALFGGLGVSVGGGAEPPVEAAGTAGEPGADAAPTDLAALLGGGGLEALHAEMLAGLPDATPAVAAAVAGAGAVVDAGAVAGAGAPPARGARRRTGRLLTQLE